MLMMLTRDAALRALARFLAAATVAGSIAVVWQQQLVTAAMPALRAWLGCVDDTYRTLDLSVVDVNGELVLQRIATPARPHLAGEAIVYADAGTRLTSQVAAGLALQPLVLAVALLIAWPWRSAAELAVRFALATPLVLAVALLDVPLTLYGFMWYQEISVVDPHGFSPLAYWADLMSAGGRFALTLAACAPAIAAAAIPIHRKNLAAGFPPLQIAREKAS
jgi:hypothetical protein